MCSVMSNHNSKSFKTRIVVGVVRIDHFLESNQRPRNQSRDVAPKFKFEPLKRDAAVLKTMG